MSGQLIRVKRRMRVAGLMSGTSADGLDVAICDISPGRADVVAFDMIAYPRAIRQAIFRLFDPATGTVDQICHMNFVLGEFFADSLIRVARRGRVALKSIDLVGSHGQTIYHIPRGRVRSTLQIAEPSIIAERTGIPVVADFRPRDIAAGGEGAPLVPFADYFLFRHARRNRALQNIGGIANVTYLPAGGSSADIVAFDTGPGNMMIDRLTSLVTNGRATFDCGGRLAAKGTVNAELLAGLMRHPYLRRRPPKTTGREMFGTDFTDRWFARARSRAIPALDILATATAFTADSIAAAYRRFVGPVDEVILCGGGAHNDTLLARLKAQLNPARVGVMDDYGLSADAKEAVSFAILAYATVHGIPNNVPSATGAARQVVLGKIVVGSGPATAP